MELGHSNSAHFSTTDMLSHRRYHVLHLPADPLVSHLQSCGWEGVQLLRVLFRWQSAVMFCFLCPTGWCWISSDLCRTVAPTCWLFATLWPGNWPDLRPCSGDRSKQFITAGHLRELCVLSVLNAAVLFPDGFYDVSTTALHGWWNIKICWILLSLSMRFGCFAA